MCFFHSFVYVYQVSPHGKSPSPGSPERHHQLRHLLGRHGGRSAVALGRSALGGVRLLNAEIMGRWGWWIWMMDMDDGYGYDMDLWELMIGCQKMLVTGKKWGWDIFIYGRLRRKWWINAIILLLKFFFCDVNGRLRLGFISHLAAGCKIPEVNGGLWLGKLSN